jgi:hypothetical protein
MRHFDRTAPSRGAVSLEAPKWLEVPAAASRRVHSAGAANATFGYDGVGHRSSLTGQSRNLVDVEAPALEQLQALAFQGAGAIESVRVVRDVNDADRASRLPVAKRRPAEPLALSCVHNGLVMTDLQCHAQRIDADREAVPPLCITSHATLV